MTCPNCGDGMDGPGTMLERAYPHDHWACESCGAELSIPLPDSPDADAMPR